MVRVINLKGRGVPCIYVGRSVARFGLQGHPLANPFKLPPRASDDDRRECLRLYTEWLDAHPRRDYLLARLADEVLRTGLPLGCWCAPKLCHADVLGERVLAILNRRGQLS